jgi:hypothetical protein
LITTRDISGLPDEVGISALCCFAEEVYTSSGRIVHSPDGFQLHLLNRKPERFATAASAVGKLRRYTPKQPRAGAAAGRQQAISPQSLP